MVQASSLRVAIIGAGPAGIAAGHELIAQGYQNFTIFEKAGAAGGTWHLHNYPGLECDLWAHSYTFSYRPNPDWSANYAGHAEIEAYLQRCATEFGLDPHFRFNTRVDRAELQADNSWLLSFDNGETQAFDVIINAMGNQHTPIYPDVPGRDSFTGEQWHSTHWNHDVDLAGKRIVVVGSAAAAVQIVPKIAPAAAQLTVLQRTPNWIMPRNWKQYSPRTQRLFQRFPQLLKIHRWFQGLLMSAVHEGVTLGHKRMEQFEARVHKFIASSIEDPAVQRAVTPDTPYGCKRGLVSDDFYPALNRDNVILLAEGLQTVQPEGVITTSGKSIEADVIIYCTGYQVLDFERIQVIGRDGRDLASCMQAAPLAFKGIAVPGFPNYFFSAGPNGLAINAPYFANVECNVKTIVTLLTQMQAKGLRAIDVKTDACDAYNAGIADRFETYSWGNSACNSYYRTSTGHAPFLFPGSFKQYRQLHQDCSIDDFEAA